MKKHKKTILIKLSTIFVFVFLLSCNDELYNNHEHNHAENKNKITLSQFKSETKIKDFKTIIKSNIQTMKSTNRTAELSDFVIDTIAIQRHISQNNKTTYSFKIYPLSNVSQQNEIFNLVYRLENNNWEQSIFSLVKKSNPSPNEEQFENKTLLFDSKITTNTTARAGEMCITEMYYVQCDGSCHGQCDGFACPTGQCIQKTIIIDFCGGSGGATGGGGDPYGNGSSDFSQSGQQPSNPYEFTPNMFDNPTYDDPNYINAIKAQHLFSNLSFAQQVWANENVEAYNQLIQHQIDNNWSDESEVFLEELIDLAIENNATFNFDNTIDPANSLVFNTVNDFQDYYDNFNNSLASDFEIEDDPIQELIKTARCRFTATNFPPYYINVQVKQQLASPTNPYNILGVTSNQSGATLATEWHQNDDFEVSYLGNIVTITFTGSISLNCFIDGIGVFYTDQVSIIIKLNKITGEFISGNLYGVD